MDNSFDDLSQFKTARHPAVAGADGGLDGHFVALEPVHLEKHSKALFDAYHLDASQFDWAYLPYGPFDNLASFRDWLNTYQNQAGPVFFAIIDKSSAKPVGLASYLNIRPEIGSIEVGHIHFSKALQNTTGATEAMYLMMHWAFSNGYRRYEWKCNAKNVRSRRAAQRLGFSFEGLFRQAAIVKGRNRDTTWFSIIDKDWPALQLCFETFLSKANFDSNGRAKKSLSASTKPLLAVIDEFSDLDKQACSIEVPVLEEDVQWMRRALELAQEAGQQGEVPVGAIVVRNGEVIGEGFNAPITNCDASAHAEIRALRDASTNEKNYRLPNCTLYVTIEPCTMCVGAMIHARVSRVVFGAREPKSGAVVSQNQLFEHPAMNSKVVYSEGILQQECSELMSSFFEERRRRKKQLKEGAK